MWAGPQLKAKPLPRCAYAQPLTCTPAHPELFLTDCLNKRARLMEDALFDAMFLDGAGFKSFLRYVENNPVRAHLARKATDWKW